MESRLGSYLLALLPKVRKLVDDSVLGRLLDAFGLSYDAAKDAIYELRRRGFLWTLGSGTNPYYATDLRTADLDRHALDRGTRRLLGETNAELEARLAIMPATRQYAGSAMGMKYLVEEVLGHTLSALTVYADDPEARIVRSEADQAAQVEAERSHLFSAADQADPEMDGLRQTRLFSQADLDMRFTFWLSILPAGAQDAEERTRVSELVMAEKPAHTACVLTYVEA
ncbi:MAG: hypothetical protein Q8O14_12745 [bacterium]|nr:hypothetical protein [bacterium]